MYFQNNVPVSLQKIKQFIINAKENSFANPKVKSSLNDNSSVYSYKDSTSNGFIFTDIYNGNIVESGRESVSFDRIEIWRNQYYGGICPFLANQPIATDSTAQQLCGLLPEQLSDIIVVFLRKALLQMPNDFPVRGPQSFASDLISFDGIDYHGDWKYVNLWNTLPLYNMDDPLFSFHGKETISFNGIEVFWHVYHGGLLYDKNYRLKIYEK